MKVTPLLSGLEFVWTVAPATGAQPIEGSAGVLVRDGWVTVVPPEFQGAINNLAGFLMTHPTQQHHGLDHLAIAEPDLKQHSPVKPLFNISMANGWYGYIPPPEAHAAGSYETWRGRTTPLATNAIPQITEAFLKMLENTK